MKNIRIAAITGIIAVIALIATIFIVAGGSSKYGLYITAVSGDVNISNSDKSTSENAEENRKLIKGDVVTVGDVGTCTIVYRTSKNNDVNYMVLTDKTQVFVNEEFDGRADTELYLNRGQIISSNAEDLGPTANIRTANCSVTTGCAVSTIGYKIDEEGNYTDFASLGGNLYVQLYDQQGNKVNNEELLGAGRNGRVVSGKDGPYFDCLNTDLDLSTYDSAMLKQIFSISARVKLEFSPEDIKAAYNIVRENEGNETEPDELDEIPISVDNATPIQTAETIATKQSDEDKTEETTIITTSETEETTTSEERTETTTKQEETTTTEETEEIDEDTEQLDDDVEELTDDDEIFTVSVIIDGVTTTQTVSYGENADMPDDPVIEGKTFVGWDRSFDNITSDTVITAIFIDDDQDSDISSVSDGEHTVTVVIGGTSTTQTVADGEAANIPSSITLEGYTFKGWDTDYSNVTSDMTVTAILEPISCTVTFIVDGTSYITQVSYGGTAVPTVTPSQNSAGQNFTGWDKSLSGITSDTTITATFDTAAETKSTYTVTFVMGDESITQTVEEGSSASAPVPPATNAKGESFLGWDGNYSDVDSDRTIYAIYG